MTAGHGNDCGHTYQHSRHPCAFRDQCPFVQTSYALNPELNVDSLFWHPIPRIVTRGTGEVGRGVLVGSGWLQATAIIAATDNKIATIHASLEANCPLRVLINPPLAERNRVAAFSHVMFDVANSHESLESSPGASIFLTRPALSGTLTTCIHTINSNF